MCICFQIDIPASSTVCAEKFWLGWMFYFVSSGKRQLFWSFLLVAYVTWGDFHCIRRLGGFSCQSKIQTPSILCETWNDYKRQNNTPIHIQNISDMETILMFCLLFSIIATAVPQCCHVLGFYWVPQAHQPTDETKHMSVNYSTCLL